MKKKIILLKTKKEIKTLKTICSQNKEAMENLQQQTSFIKKQQQDFDKKSKSLPLPKNVNLTREIENLKKYREYDRRR